MSRRSLSRTSRCSNRRRLKFQTVCVVLVVLLCCQLPRVAEASLLSLLFGAPSPPPAATKQYFLESLASPLETLCVGSYDPSKATFDNPDYLIISSVVTSQSAGHTLCTSNISLLASQSDGSYSPISPLLLPLGAAFQGWNVSNWQALPTDIVQLTIANRGLLPLLVGSLTNVLRLLPFIGSAVTTGPASSFTTGFTSLAAVQSFLLSASAPPSGVLQGTVIVYGTTLAYVLYQADSSGAISFYIFESNFSILFRRRNLLAEPNTSTQGSTCTCRANPHPAPSCVSGSNSYAGCRYICNC